MFTFIFLCGFIYFTIGILWGAVATVIESKMAKPHSGKFYVISWLGQAAVWPLSMFVGLCWFIQPKSEFQKNIPRKVLGFLGNLVLPDK